MTIYEFAPPRLNEGKQRALRWIVASVTVVLFATSLFFSWPHDFDRWVQLSIVLVSVSLASVFVYRVSSIDQLFAFGLTGSILAVLGPFTHPAFIVTAWSVAMLLGLTLWHRSFFVATQAALCMWFAAAALVFVWRLTDNWLASAAMNSSDAMQMAVEAHVPQIVASLVAFYLARTVISTVRALVLTKLTLTEIILRVSWVRVGIMLIGECFAATVVSVAAGLLNSVVFQSQTPFGKSISILLISTTVFGIAAKMQARRALERINSLVEASARLPWPISTSVEEQAAEFAQKALPSYVISSCGQQRNTSRDHIVSLPIEKDDESHYLVAVRRAGQPPFRIEDQRILDSVAQIANETIRGRKEVHRLRRLANTDRLTGLLNYRAFQMALDDLSDWHTGDELVALIFIDIDNFKSINDTYGHEIGNRVLREVGQRLNGVIASPGMVARVGGDEFVILLPNVASRSEVEDLQAKLHADVAVPIEEEGAVISLRLSQGVAYSTPGQKDLSALVELADHRMYESRGNRLATAEGNGRFDPRPKNEPGIVLALREGIKQRRLELVYQPIIDLQQHEIVAVEALMRYTDPKHGVVPVGLLLSEAERLGLLPELSDQLLRLAVQTVVRIRQRYPELHRLHFNISLAQLLDDRFTRLVDEINAAHPDITVVLEINEDSLRDSSPDTVDAVEDFAARSEAILAIDDIGKTHTGLASLRDYPFAVWKMDRSVMDSYHSDRTPALIRGLIGISRELDADLVFEGVETEAQHEWLLNMGARYAQGFLYGRPVSADELLLRFDSAGIASRV